MLDDKIPTIYEELDIPEEEGWRYDKGYLVTDVVEDLAEELSSCLGITLHYYEHGTFFLEGLEHLYNPYVAYFIEVELYNRYYWDRRIKAKPDQQEIRKNAKKWAKEKRLYKSHSKVLILRIINSLEKAIAFLETKKSSREFDLHNIMELAGSEFGCELAMEWSFGTYWLETEYSSKRFRGKK